MKRTIMCGLLSLAASCFTAPAWAQETTDVRNNDAEPENDRKARTPREMEEVVVTAQKRMERLQDVPISISVLGGADLDKFTGSSVNDALAMSPGLTTNQGGIISNATVLSVRGVSAAAAWYSGSSPVAYYVDSVPFGFQRQAIVPDPNAYDMERVEVLRGPQGTLYGANALNGVVRVLTHDADLHEFQMKARGSVSDVDHGSTGYRGDIVANFPIVTDKLAARVVLGSLEEGGWIDRTNKNDTNSGHVRNARLKINAQPTKELSIGLSAWTSRSEYGASTVSTDQYRYDGVVDQPQSGDFDAYGLKLGYRFSNFSISSMTSYVSYVSDSLLDATPLAAVVGAPSFIGATYFTGLDSRVLSEEILLASTGEGSWRWSAGAFYRDAKDQSYQYGAFVIAPIKFNDLSKSGAIFGELTRLFWDGKLELTGGLRYFEDHVTLQELMPHSGVEGTPLIYDRDKFDDVSPRAVVTWHPSAQQTFYGSYAKGFRSGINQYPVAGITPEYPPANEDSLKNYELGAKGTLLSGRFGYEAAVYYMDWKDVQQVVNVPTPRGVASAVINGKSASGLGIDVGLVAQLTDGLELNFNVSWNDLGFDEPILNPATGALVFGKGDRLVLSSEYVAGASLKYGFMFGGSGLAGGVSTGVNWRSKQATRTVNDPAAVEGDDILLARADVSIGSPDRWRTLLFVENLTNERGLIMPNAIPSWSTYTRPRTIGLQFEYFY